MAEEKNDLIDMEEILVIMDNDTELIRECFHDFLNEYPRMLQLIKEAVDAGDTEGLEKHAHKIKGSLQYLAAAEAADIAFQLEQKGKAGQMDGAGQLLDELAELCAQLKVIMTSYTG